MESPFKGKKNIYLCAECGHGFVSQDRDSGTTPYTTACLNCGSLARSMMYAAPQEILADVKPALVWYAPTPEETAKLSPSVQAHIERGGLISRHTGKRKPKKKAFRV